jgi:NADH-quinone oxidoreductase subunit G
VEAGALPNLLPGGRPVADPAARVDVAAAWDVDSLPTHPGRDTGGILAAAARGDLGALVVGGVDPADLPDPAVALNALDAARFVVSLEVRRSEVTSRADVVLPVAPNSEKAGTYLNWEGRWRDFPAALATNALSDFRALDMLADQMDVVLGLRGVERVRSEIAELDAWEGSRAVGPGVGAVDPAQPGPGHAVLATWHQLLDAGRLQDDEPYLAGTAHAPVARLSPATAAEVGVSDGAGLEVATARGSITLPAVVTAMPDRVVWLPTNAPASRVRSTLGVGAGAVVSIRPASTDVAGTGEHA